ncbi:hypothetical protein evm_003716 [Chilo suppressalis]|nr:hypothetical protein evm_003716 [Chilo suppressalis]
MVSVCYGLNVVMVYNTFKPFIPTGLYGTIGVRVRLALDAAQVVRGGMQGGGAPAADADQAQFEADKRAVYKHPLFPLLALLLERCEQATAGAEPPAADAFGADLQAFVQHQRRDRRPFLVDDPEIDGLMIKSIQVLRIHLLELEKVQELCRDFCGRYIACLKTKMQSENLLRTDYSSGGVESNNNLSGSLDDHSSTSNSPQYQQSTPATAFPAVFPQHPELPFPPHPRDPPSLVVQGSTPISQIGAGLLPTDSFTDHHHHQPINCPHCWGTGLPLE